jgi:hypothetical protein
MAAFLPHIVYGQVYLRRRPDLDVRRFLRGSVAPDIRLLAGLPREVTHRKGVSLAAVDAETDAWKVGFLLHSYLDEAWTAFMSRYSLTPGKAEDEMMWIALKVAEEASIFDRVADREACVAAFSGEADPEELAMGASAEVVRLWDAFLRHTIVTPFEPEVWVREAQKLGHSLAMLREVAPMIVRVGYNAVWKERFERLHEELGYGRD